MVGEQHHNIKGRCFSASSPAGQRVGSLCFGEEWDATFPVLLDLDFETLKIWEALRADLKPLLTAPRSKARVERGQLGVNQFKRVGRCMWCRSV